MALSGSISIAWNLTEQVDTDLRSGLSPLNASWTWNVATGTGSGQADKIWSDTRSLGASATEDLDLSGVLTDLFGTVTFAKMKAFAIRSAAANLNNINVSRPAGATGVPWFLAVSDGFVLTPGGMFLYALPQTGITVTNSTADLITITNAAGTNTVSYDVVIVGTSA
jgi:hypothetical protein